MALFDHMGEVCSYLDAYVELALIDATHENTRFALRELACQELGNDEKANMFLQRGFGCDGIDNTCDPTKTIDECAEDVFPPDITTTALQECGGETIFTTVEAAKDCVNVYTSAEDDCKSVITETSADVTDSCTATVTFKATAQGCHNRPLQDISIVNIPVKVDSVAPTVSCKFAPGESLLERYAYEGGMILRASNDELKDGVFSIDVEVRIDTSVLATLQSLSG
jgi:hypothetical protein